jgi:hypothetical protein
VHIHPSINAKQNTFTSTFTKFNFRLSRGRQTIECSFGILSAKWRIFRRPIRAAVSTVESIIEACVCLHNFVIDNDPERLLIYVPISNKQDNGFGNLVRNSCNRPADTPIKMRNALKNLFLDDLRLQWQEHRAFRTYK